MKRRDPKSIARLAAVQDRKRQLAQWKLVAAEGEIVRLTQEREDLIAALDGHMPSDLIVPQVSRRLSALERDAVKANQQKDAAEAVYIEESRRTKLAERLSDAARRAQERQQEAVDLENALENWSGAATQGSHKLEKP